MSEPAIEVEKLSKRYRLDRPRASYGSLRDDIARLARSLGRLHRPLDSPGEELHALSDVSFSLAHGRILGIVGANGAGKSTLLRILSGITLPTTGRAIIRGTVSSLLEVGTGFHPELTGAENVYLSAAILGMPRAETRRRFDEIVEFAGVADLLNTPVKHYSSGLYMRLGFAVAAHLRSDVLLVDEVLAVGDAQFQRKSSQKLKEVVRDGRTVIFVSHNLAAVRNICDHALWLREGRIAGEGRADDIVAQYSRGFGERSATLQLSEQVRRIPADPVFELRSVGITQGGSEQLPFDNDRPVEVVVEYCTKAAMMGLRIYIDVKDELDDLLFRTIHDETAESQSVVSPGIYRSSVTIPANLFAPKYYRLVLNASIHHVRECLPPISLGIYFVHTMPTHRAYLEDLTEAKLLPMLPWRTCRIGD